MKIYVYSCSYLDDYKNIKVRQVEAIEDAQTYKVFDGESFAGGSHTISKRELDKISDGFRYSMNSLSDDKHAYFVNEIKKLMEDDIRTAEDNLERQKSKLSKFLTAQY